MRKASNSPGLLERLRARAAAPEPDAADLGTAFGLEVSLDRQQAADAPVTWQPPAWVQRLGARGRRRD